MNENYSKQILIAIVLFFGTSIINAQRITIGPGINGGTNLFGPFNTDTAANSFSRVAYIYDQSLLDGIRHGDSITAIDFEKTSFATFSGTANCIIWMGNTTKVDFGPNNIHFLAERLNLNTVQVYNSNPIAFISGTEGYKRLDLATFYKYDTSRGKNLAIFVEYIQATPQNVVMNWNFDVAGNMPAYINNQLKQIRGKGLVIPDSTNFSSSIHPNIRLYIPRNDYEARIVIPYLYGKMPVPLGNPDTMKILVENLGKKSFNGQKAFVNSAGANVFFDSLVMPMLSSYQSIIINYPIVNIFNRGFDTLTFSITADSSNLDNRSIFLRQATDNVYSYRHLLEPPAPGGIGFNGITGNFVAKFASNAAKAINQIEVSFGFGNNPFRAAIWESNPISGKPGKLLWQSDSLISTNKSIVPVVPPVQVNGNFYAGVRQLGTNNVSFAYQLEQPVRPQTFWYSTPLADTNWVDFAPNAPFRFMIEPRLQAPYDLMVLKIDSPKNRDTFDYFKFDTVRPTATIYNLGANDADTSVLFKCNMFIGNTLVFSATKLDTIKSGRVKKMVFDTAHVFQFSGDYRMEIMSLWNKDTEKYNDTQRINFVVAYYNDAAIDNLFVPFNGQILEYKFDSLRPIIRIKNFAYNNLSNLKVRSRIWSGQQLIYNDSNFVNLSAGATAIISPKSWFAVVKDSLLFETITTLANDRNKPNDTLRRWFRVAKIFDVSSDSMILPSNQQILDLSNNAPKPSLKVSNLSVGDAQNVITFISIVDKNKKLIYSDTQRYNLLTNQSLTIQFIDSLKLVNKGKYFVTAITRVAKDFETFNDTLQTVFYFGIQNDAQSVSINKPINTLVYELNEGVFCPKATIRNNGFDSFINVPFQLTGLSNGVPFYISVKTATLDTNQSIEISFDSTLVFSSLDNVVLRLVTLLNNDQNKSNDTFLQSYSIQVSNDIGVDAVLLPPSFRYPTKSVLFPKVLLSNLGLKAQQTPFNVNCKVLNSLGQVFYDLDRNITIDSGAQILVDFNTNLILTDTGKYTMVVRSFLPSDQNGRNDFKSINFDIYNAHNLYLKDFTPLAATRYLPGFGTDTLRPKFRLLKTGEEFPKDSMIIYATILGKNSGYKYEDSIMVFSQFVTDTLLRFSKPFNTNIVDTFLASYMVKSQLDGNAKDDTLRFNFIINFGVGIDKIALNELGFLLSENPSNGIWEIKSSLNEEIKSIKVYSTDGRLLFTNQYSNKTQNTTINLSHLPDGVFLLFINDSNSAIKLLKQKSR